MVAWFVVAGSVANDAIMIAVSCKHCGAKSKAPEREGGRTIECPECGASISVPPSNTPVTHDELKLDIENYDSAARLEAVPKASPPELPWQRIEKQERVYLRENGALVTTTRAELDGVLYPVGNITSVRIETMRPGYGRVVLFMLFGVSLLVLGIYNIATGGNSSIGWICTVCGGFLIAVGGLIAARLRPKYSLVLGTAGGENHVRTSADSAAIGRVREAISRAIAHRH